MSRWFRHYAGMMRDEKLVRASLKCGQSVERVCWIWGAILESAAELNDDGRYDLDNAEVAYFLRADVSDVDAVVAALEQGGRIAGGRVVKWSDRQFQSDRSAERQKRYREKQKAHGNDASGSSRADVERNGDASVTSPLRHGDAPDSDSETNTEKIKFKGRENLNGVAPQAPVADLIAAASRKGGDKSNYLWLKQSDTRVPQMREWWRSNYGTDPPLTYRNGRPGYHVPWAAVNGH